MSRKQRKKDYIDNVTIYFYRSGEYFALKRKNSLAYFPKVKIDKYSDDLGRDYVKNKVFTKIFSSNKIDYKTFKSNICNHETIKVKHKSIKVIRIELNDVLYSEIESKLVPCKNNKLKVDSECYKIIRTINRKHYSPIYMGTLFLGVLFLVLGIISLFFSNLNSRLIDVTAFLSLLFSEIATFVINRLLKIKIQPIGNVFIIFISFVLAIMISQTSLMKIFDNGNSSALSIISMGIALLLAVKEYFIKSRI